MKIRRMSIIIAIVLLVVTTGCSTTPTTTTIQQEAFATQSNVVNNAETAVAASVTTTDLISGTHDDAGDYTWDASTEVQIVFSGNSVEVNKPAVTVEGSLVTITAEGNYRLSGSLADGQVVVDTSDSGSVRLILDGVDLTSSTSAPIFIDKAEKVIIVLAEESQNYLTDAVTYVYPNEDEDEPNAALFSDANLTITGTGSLTVNAKSNDGISSKDGLIIAGGDITVNAVDDGIRGKDYLVIKDGTLNVTAGGDGLKSDEDEDTTLGNIAILNGTFSIESDGDAIAAQTNLAISSGEFTLTAGGGNGTQLSTDASAKGIKGLATVSISGGTYVIDSADDAIHSNGGITIDGSNFEISSGDDAVHADQSLLINAGEINVLTSYEGLESTLITINGGTIHLVSSDDGINGSDGSGSQEAGIPAPGAGRQGPGGMNNDMSSSIVINGGYIYVDANGDGVDVNGSIEMNDGILLVNGPLSNGNGALDYNGEFTMNGGTLLAVGSAGMAMTPSADSTLNSLLVGLDQVQPAGILISLLDANGNALFTFAPSKEYQSVVYASASLESGSDYQLYFGGTVSGSQSDGLYTNATYTTGELVQSFTASQGTTQIGSTGGMGGGPRRR